jgi:chromosome segregation ATPase
MHVTVGVGKTNSHFLSNATSKTTCSFRRFPLFETTTQRKDKPTISNTTQGKRKERKPLFYSVNMSEHPSRNRSVFSRGAVGGKRRMTTTPGGGSQSGPQKKAPTFQSPPLLSMDKHSYHTPYFSSRESQSVDSAMASRPDTRGNHRSTNVVTPTHSIVSEFSPIHQSEAMLLIQKLQAMGSISKKGDLLLGQVKVLAEESQRKDEKLRILNDQLHDIQRGLSQIDDERIRLQRKVQQLEDDKRKVHQQLDLREAEVLTLVKRCASQEEKVKESTLLRCKNAELDKEVGELRSILAEQENDQTYQEDTVRELQACHQRLEHTKRDHDAMASTLQNCLAQIGTLTHEKQDWEDERRRLLNRADVEIEKERLQHLSEMNELKVRLHTAQDKVEKLEEFMKDKSMTNLMLRKDNGELNKWKTQTSVKLEEYERQIRELTEENKEKQKEIMEISATSWEPKVKEKEKIIESLQDELSALMIRSMSVSETVEVLQEESEELEELVEHLQEKLKSYYSWGEEREAMLHYLSVTQDHIKELTKEVVNLQFEKDELEDKNLELQQQASATSRNEHQDLEKNSNTGPSWRHMEEILEAKIASLEAAIVAKQESTDVKLKAAEDNIRALEWTVASRTKDTIRLQKDLDEARDIEEDNLNQIKSLESKLSAVTGSREEAREVGDELRAKYTALETKLRASIDELKQSHDRTEKLKMAFQDKETELVEVSLALASANKELSNVKFHRETIMVELNSLKETTARYGAEGEAKEEKMNLSNKRIGQLDRQLQIRTDETVELLKAKSDLEVELQATRAKLEGCVASEQLLRSDLDAAHCEIDESKALINDVETKLAGRDEALSLALREAEEKLQCSLSRNLALESEVSDAQEALASMKAELSDLRETVQRHEGESQILRCAIEKLQTNTALKDDEIRDLRLIELKDLEEEKSSLQEQVTAKEAEISSLVGKLETLSIRQLERELEVSGEINSLKATLSSLKKEYQHKEAGFLAAGEDALKELKSNTVALQRRNQLLEKRITSLKTEKDLILASEESVLSEKTMMEAELLRLRGLVESKDSMVQEGLARINSLETSRAEMERLVTERTVVPGAIEETSGDGFPPARDTQQLKDERDAPVRALRREEIIREGIQAEVEALSVHAQIASTKRQPIETENLKAENGVASDRSEHQATVSMKQIETEKAARGRTSSGRSITTPAQLAAARTARFVAMMTRSSQVESSENIDPVFSTVRHQRV